MLEYDEYAAEETNATNAMYIRLFWPKSIQKKSDFFCFGFWFSPFLKLDRAPQPQQFTQQVASGHTWLLLKTKPSSAALATGSFGDDVAYVTGQIVLYDEQTSLAATILPVQGVFLRRLGRVTLFGNSRVGHVQWWPSRPRHRPSARPRRVWAAPGVRHEQVRGRRRVAPALFVRLFVCLCVASTMRVRQVC